VSPLLVGAAVPVGAKEGEAEGEAEGLLEGLDDGLAKGDAEGVALLFVSGDEVRTGVGDGVGLKDGEGIGFIQQNANDTNADAAHIKSWSSAPPAA
jgi:hypothetical protein